MSSSRTLHAHCFNTRSEVQIDEEERRTTVDIKKMLPEDSEDVVIDSVDDHQNVHKKSQGDTFDEFETPIRYEVNIDPRSPQDVLGLLDGTAVKGVAGCFKWEMTLQLASKEIDPAYICTGSAVSLSFLANQTTVICSPFNEGTGLRPFLTKKARGAAADPRTIFIIENHGQSEEIMRWRKPYRFRHLLSGGYLSISFEKGPNKVGTWRTSIIKGHRRYESSISLLPASLEKNELIRRDSAIGWLCCKVPKSHIIDVSKKSSLNKIAKGGGRSSDFASDLKNRTKNASGASNIVAKIGATALEGPAANFVERIFRRNLADKIDLYLHDAGNINHTSRSMKATSYL